MSNLRLVPLFQRRHSISLGTAIHRFPRDPRWRQPVLRDGREFAIRFDQTFVLCLDRGL